MLQEPRQEPLRLKSWKYQTIQDPSAGTHRRGHIEGVLEACKRFSRGDRFTSVVLPTRYGKSDLARFITFAGVYGLETPEGIIQPFTSCVLFLSHQNFLANQILDNERWKLFVRRIGFENLKINNPRIAPIPKKPTSLHGIPSAIFISSTVHKIADNTDLFGEWIRSLPKPPIIIADEAQFYSESADKAWGPALEAVAKAGAFVLPMTGTPIRADRQGIPGFEQTLTSSGENTFNVIEVVDENPELSEEEQEGKSYIKIDKYKRQFKHYELEPHFLIGRAEAWQLKYLCRVQRALIDIKTDKGFLRLLPISQQTTALSKALREKSVIEDFIDVASKKLAEYRKHHTNPGCIVFTQDNRNNDNHEQRVARIIESRGYEVIRATMDSSGDALSEQIKRFADHGQGQFLIVKQAAGAGLDCPRIKVCVDLSNVRTDAACEQRWNRCATPAQSDITGCMITTATLIAPDETRGNLIFKRIYEDEGGSAAENVDELIETTYVEHEKTFDPIFIEGTGGTRYDDVNGLEAEGSDVVRAERFLNIIQNTTPSSGIASTTVPEAALLVRTLKLTDSHLQIKEETPEELEFSPVNPQVEIQRLRSQNVELCNIIDRLRGVDPMTGKPKHGGAFAEAYKRINRKRGTSVFESKFYRETVDVEAVRRVNEEMRQMLKEAQNG